jgi:p21-activated kinase 1
VDTWEGIRSERNWAADVDLQSPVIDSPEVMKKKTAIVFPQTVLDELDMGPPLGEGHFGTVFSAKKKADQSAVCVKMMANDVQLKAAAQLALKLAEKKIAQISEVEKVIESESDLFVILRERRGGPVVAHVLQHLPLTEQRVAIVLRDVLRGLEALHAAELVHLDVVLDNLLCESNAADSKVSLEGLALLRDVGTGGLVRGGAVPFQSPEIVFNAKYNSKTDIWSLGVVAYVLLTGNLPFPETHTMRLKVSIKTGLFEQPETLSEAAKSFLQKCLVVDPEQRASASELLATELIQSPGTAEVKDFAANIAKWQK